MDVSGNDLNDSSFEVSHESEYYSYSDIYNEVSGNEVQSELLVASDSPNSYDYSSDFQNVFTLLSLIVAVLLGGFCFLCFTKGFK